MTQSSSSISSWQAVALPVALLAALGACNASGEFGFRCHDCDDGVYCTLDSCNPETGECTNEPTDNLCTPPHTCDATVGCVSPPSCKSDDECDDDPCIINSHCQVGMCTAGTNICTCQSDDDCDDDPCIINSHCQAGECTAGTYICSCASDDDCDDDPCIINSSCQAGECTAGTNICPCQNASDCADYDDGNLCNGEPACVEHQCVANGTAPVTCNDLGEICRQNVCDPDTGSCHAVPVNDGASCPVATCDGDGHCESGACVPPVPCCIGGDCPEGCLEEPPEPPGVLPLPDQTPPGGVETRGGDDYVYNAENTIKIGMRRAWGGTIIFFGMTAAGSGMNNSNTIDANDTGREVQVAFYDPDRYRQNCAWNASCQTPGTNDCPISITYLGWNPVQGGNRCNNGSGVESSELDAGVSTMVVNPLQWNPNWDRTDCSDAACNSSPLNTRRSEVEVTQRIRFVRQHVAEIDYTIVNHANLSHGVTGHEMPTVYTANGNGGPDLWRLFNSDGTEIPIDQLAPGSDGFYYKTFNSPGGWAAMQNDNLDYGVGLYSESRPTQFTGWQKRSLPFNNFRPTMPFAIPAHGEVHARAYLIIGSLGTIQAEAAWLDNNLPPFGWLDEPVPESTVGSSTLLRGWALDNKGVSSVRARIDGVDAGQLPYNHSRPDVCLVWPGYANCGSSGFRGTINTAGLSACGHLLEILARDHNGNERVIARTRIFGGG